MGIVVRETVNKFCQEDIINANRIRVAAYQARFPSLDNSRG